MKLFVKFGENCVTVGLNVYLLFSDGVSRLGLGLETRLEDFA